VLFGDDVIYLMGMKAQCFRGKAVFAAAQRAGMDLPT
jgi:hypothetical protein